MLVVQLILIFCMSAIPLSKGQAKECPPAEDLKPCKCEKMVPDDFVDPTLNLPLGGVFVDCTGAPMSDVRTVMGKMQNLKIGAFVLRSLQSGEPLPADFFQDLTLHAISIVDSKFTFPKPTPFQGIEDSLWSLHIKKSQVDFINLPLKHLNNLKHMGIQDIALPNWRPDNKIPNSLEVLFMSNCGIKTFFWQHYVYYLPNLKILKLRYNTIEHLSREVYDIPAHEHLHTLDLSRNKIRNFDKYFFDGMPRLREVNMAGNQLQTLLWWVWEPIWYRLKVLRVEDNPFECKYYPIAWICNVAKPKELVGSCDSPDNLKGVPIDSKAFCDIQGQR